MSGKTAALLCLVLVFCTFIAAGSIAYSTRYTMVGMVTGSGEAVIYRLDRWTGKTVIVFPIQGGVAIIEAKPYQPARDLTDSEKKALTALP